jgi:hypothetical protein
MDIILLMCRWSVGWWIDACASASACHLLLPEHIPDILYPCLTPSCPLDRSMQDIAFVLATWLVFCHSPFWPYCPLARRLPCVSPWPCSAACQSSVPTSDCRGEGEMSTLCVFLLSWACRCIARAELFCVRGFCCLAWLPACGPYSSHSLGRGGERGASAWGNLLCHLACLPANGMDSFVPWIRHFRRMAMPHFLGMRSVMDRYCGVEEHSSGGGPFLWWWAFLYYTVYKEGA